MIKYSNETLWSLVLLFGFLASSDIYFKDKLLGTFLLLFMAFMNIIMFNTLKKEVGNLK